MFNPTPSTPLRSNPRQRRHDEGFTLLEILIAIVLVGVLSAVAQVGISALLGKGSKSACIASAGASAAASATYFTSYGAYPADFSALTTATGSGSSAIPAALTFPAGVTITGSVATSTGGGWALTMAGGTATSAPTFTCTVNGPSPLSVTWPVLPDGQVGVVYATTNLPAKLGTSPYSWLAIGLPRGIGIGPVSGTVYGTPTLAGTFPVTFTVTDATGASLAKTYSLVIAAASAACPVSVVGWKGEYFGSPDLSGPPAICRDDPSINFDWGSAAPGVGLPMDNFSVRWTATQTWVGGLYTFTLGTDDGGRLFVDGLLVLNRWVNQMYPANPPSVTQTLTPGTHLIVVEYYDSTATARATLVISPST